MLQTLNNPEDSKLPGFDIEPEIPGEKIRFLNLPELPGAHLLHAEPGGRCWRVFHENYEICVMPLEGNPRDSGASYIYRGKQHSMRPGDFMLLEPGELHVNPRVYAPGNYWVLFVEPEVMAPFAEELGLGPKPHFRLTPPNMQFLIVHFTYLHSLIRKRASRLEQQSMLAKAIKVLLSSCGDKYCAAPSAKFHPALKLAREYIHEHWSEPIALDTLVAVTGLSCYHLVRTFRTAYGMPPHAYQNQIRISEARKQLSSGVPSAFVDVGFYDQTHLIRHFKRVYGVTPGQYQMITRKDRRGSAPSSMQQESYTADRLASLFHTR